MTKHFLNLSDAGGDAIAGGCLPSLRGAAEILVVREGVHRGAVELGSGVAHARAAALADRGFALHARGAPLRLGGRGVRVPDRSREGEHAEARHVLAIPRDVRQALALVLRQAGIVRGVRHLERDVSAARGGRGDASREASVCAIANRAGHGRFSADNVAVQARDSIVRTDDAPTVSSEKTVGFERRDRPRSRARPLGGHTARRARPASRLSR